MDTQDVTVIDFEILVEISVVGLHELKSLSFYMQRWREIYSVYFHKMFIKHIT